jgi:hypothetical protein
MERKRETSGVKRKERKKQIWRRRRLLKKKFGRNGNRQSMSTRTSRSRSSAEHREPRSITALAVTTT